MTSEEALADGDAAGDGDIVAVDVIALGAADGEVGSRNLIEMLPCPLFVPCLFSST